MDVLVVLIAATLLFRLLGRVKVKRFDSWLVSASYGLAVMLVVTASAHFVPASVTVMPNHADMARMVPPFVPYASVMVYLTGVFELMGAVGLMLTATRRAAGGCLALMFVAMLPANVYAAIAHVPFNGGEVEPLWFRVPLQLLFIGIAAWAAFSATARVDRPRSARTKELSWTH